jgi:large conductance mechanosensitive channel
MEKIDKEKAITKTKGLIDEFKTFVKRGNVLDLAIGVVLGTAFGKIVSSLVDNIIMPLIGIIIGGLDFSNLSIKVGDASIKYGIFLQNVLDFIIIAFCIFLIVKALNSFLNKTKKEETKAVPTKSEEVKLLEEIRDELKK